MVTGALKAVRTKNRVAVAGTAVLGQLLRRMDDSMSWIELVAGR